MDAEIRKTLGQNIQRIRKFKGLGGMELGKKVGLSREVISKIENGKQKNLGLDYLLKISKELGIAPEELFQQNGNLLTLRFVISEHNIETLKELIKIIKDLIENK